MALSKKETLRSPIKQKPLRSPGDSLRDAAIEVWDSEFTAWLVVVFVAVALAGWEWWRWFFTFPPSPWTVTAVALVVTVVAVVKMRRVLSKLDRLRLGREGERAVGEALDDLRAAGYRVFHDVPGDGFNVDHVLIGPGGVFVIETKTRSKPEGRKATITYDGEQIKVDGFAPDRDPLVQVQANCRYVRELIERGCTVRPFIRGVVLFPGWWIERQPRGVDVWVLNEKVLPGFLHQEDRRLSADQIANLSECLATQVRLSA